MYMCLSQVEIYEMVVILVGVEKSSKGFMYKHEKVKKIWKQYAKGVEYVLELYCGG